MLVGRCALLQGQGIDALEAHRLSCPAPSLLHAFEIDKLGCQADGQMRYRYSCLWPPGTDATSAAEPAKGPLGHSLCVDAGGKPAAQLDWHRVACTAGLATVRVDWA